MWESAHATVRAEQEGPRFDVTVEMDAETTGEVVALLFHAADPDLLPAFQAHDAGPLRITFRLTRTSSAEVAQLVDAQRLSLAQ